MSIFDIIAKIAVFLHETNDEYNIVSDYCCGNFAERLSFDLDEKVGCTSLALCDEYDWLSLEVEKMIREKQFIQLAHILQKLDSKIGKLDFEYLDDGEDIFYPLNSILLEKAYILPRLERFSKWKHTYDDLSESVNKLLRNVLFVYKCHSNEYTIVNHYIRTYSPLRRFIVVGSPIGNNTKLDVKNVDDNFVNKMTFDVRYEDSEKFIDAAVYMILKADCNKADFFAFPELISNHDLNEGIINKVKRIGLMHLQIIALPTYYDGEKHKNVGDVYYVKEKRVLFSQNKTFPFIQYKNGQSETDVKEMIVKNKEIHVLHIDGIGRIVFPICKDVLVDKYMSICREIRANLIIVRSFSPGEYNYKYFLRVIRGYTSFECNGFWINSCSYKLDSGNADIKKVICVTAKSKCDKNEEQEGSCIYHCEGDCQDCLFDFCVGGEEL